MGTISGFGTRMTDAETPSSSETDDSRRRCAELEYRISDHEQIVQTLTESEERLRILFERAPDGYYLCDLLGNFMDGNVAAEALVGFSRDDLIGKTFFNCPCFGSRTSLERSSSLH